VKKKESDNRSAADTAAISLVGRFLTFAGRTMYLSHFGTGNLLLNAFTFALQLPNVLFNVAGTALSTVVIPVYNSLLAEEKPNEAKKFIDNAISISFILLTTLVVLGIIAAPWISSLLEGGNFENTEYLTFALRVLFPTIIFFGFGTIFQGLLQSHGFYRLPAFVTAPGGIILILYVVFFGNTFGVTGLLFATFIGLVMQSLILIPAVRRLGYKYKFSFDLRDKNVRAAGKLCIPVLISVVSYQMHFLFGHSVALRFGTTAVMDYAQQLVQAFVLTIVFAIVAVYFPKLSVLWAKSDSHGFGESLRKAMLFTGFLIMPAAAGFFLLRFEIMEFLLGWRDNSYTDTTLAGNLMGLYAVSVVVISFKEVGDRAFYSGKDSKTPAIFGVIIMVVNIAATLALISVLGTYAMPVAYGIAAIIGGGGLLFRLNMKTRFINFSFVVELSKMILAVCVMAVAVIFARNLSGLVGLVVSALVGVVVYFLMASVLRISSLRALRNRHGDAQ